MPRLFPLLVSTALLAISGTGVAYTQTATEPDYAHDGRQILYLTPEQRTHVQTEMRNFLMGIQQMTQAIADEDREAISEIAASMGPKGPNGTGMGGQGRGMGNGQGKGNSQGMGMGQGGGMGIMANQPPEFHAISRPLRQGFRQISQMADTASMKDIQTAFSDNLTYCALCHTTFTARDAD